MCPEGCYDGDESDPVPDGGVGVAVVMATTMVVNRLLRSRGAMTSEGRWAARRWSRAASVGICKGRNLGYI